MEKPKETKSENKIVSKSSQTIHSFLKYGNKTGCSKSQQTNKNRLFLVFIHAMNVPFQRKQKECLKGNREGRKALICSVYPLISQATSSPSI